MNPTPKLYEMNDCDWWVAHSREEAIDDYCGDDRNEREEIEEWGHARELSEEELDRLTFWNSENTDRLAYEHWQCECGAMAGPGCRWNGQAYEHSHGYPAGHVVMKCITRLTFREALAKHIADGCAIPGFFASTEA